MNVYSKLEISFVSIYRLNAATAAISKPKQNAEEIGMECGDKGVRCNNLLYPTPKAIIRISGGPIRRAVNMIGGP